MVTVLIPLAALATVVALPVLIMRVTGGMALKTGTVKNLKED